MFLVYLYRNFDKGKRFEEPWQNKNISRPRAKSRSRRLSGNYFQAFLGPGPKIIPEGFQPPIFQHFQAQIQKSLQKDFGKLFLSISRPRPQNRSRGLPAICFQAFPGPGPKIAPEGFQEAIFKHFQAQAQKSFQKPSRKSFSSISKPRCKNRSRSFPGAIFKNFQAQARKSSQKPSRNLF